MNKYIGKYRVRTPIDIDGEFTDNIEDTYIRGKNGTEIYRYNENILALYVPSSTYSGKIFKELKKYFTKESIEKIEKDIQEGNGLGESVFYFDERHLKNIDNMIKLETYGSNIPPRSIKNLPKIKHKIIDEQTYINLKKDIHNYVEESGGGINLYDKIYTQILIELKLLEEYKKIYKEKRIKKIDYLDSIGKTREAINIFNKLKNKACK